MIREVSGEKYNAKEYPKTAELLKGVMQDTRLLEFAIKFKLLRARPYHLDLTLNLYRKYQHLLLQVDILYGHIFKHIL